MQKTIFPTLLLTSLLFLGTGCFRPQGPAAVPLAPPAPEATAFGTPVTLAVGEGATYADGLTVTLKEIADSRCPEDVLCVWQGELSALLGFQGGTAGDAGREVRIGTVNQTEATAGGYRFRLGSATTSSISLLVTVAAPEKPSDYSDLITVDAPKAGAVVTSPLSVTGEARGTWYFEASFPVTLVDADGNVLVAHYAMAQGEWMTTEFVPFVSTLEFATPSTATGTLIIENDNPSGLPEHAKRIEIPVQFSSKGGAKPVACRPTGCSGQVCSDEDVMTTCEYREEYACYQQATCERQQDGNCGWTMTSELQRCLANP